MWLAFSIDHRMSGGGQQGKSEQRAHKKSREGHKRYLWIIIFLTFFFIIIVITIAVNIIIILFLILVLIFTLWCFYPLRFWCLIGSETISNLLINNNVITVIINRQEMKHNKPVWCTSIHQVCLSWGNTYHQV